MPLCAEIDALLPVFSLQRRFNGATLSWLPAGVPVALMGHHIMVEKKRPRFPLVAPADYKELTEMCWDADFNQR